MKLLQVLSNAEFKQYSLTIETQIAFSDEGSLMRLVSVDGLCLFQLL
jgi:hypothetical protein